MGLLDHPRCENCRLPDGRIRYDEGRRRWLCRDCWSLLGPPAGTAPHPEDRPGWRIEVRRRLS